MVLIPMQHSMDGKLKKTNGTVWDLDQAKLQKKNLGHTYHLVKMRTGHPADIQTVPEAVWSFTVN